MFHIHSYMNGEISAKIYMHATYDPGTDTVEIKLLCGGGESG